MKATSLFSHFGYFYFIKEKARINAGFGVILEEIIPTQLFTACITN